MKDVNSSFQLLFFFLLEINCRIWGAHTPKLWMLAWEWRILISFPNCVISNEETLASWLPVYHLRLWYLKDSAQPSNSGKQEEPSGLHLPSLDLPICALIFNLINSSKPQVCALIWRQRWTWVSASESTPLIEKPPFQVFLHNKVNGSILCCVSRYPCI